jgi:isoquinoline 1-oxidoreductase beta subunit
VRAQVTGAVIFGITAALYGEITLKDGRVEQTNFHTYRPLRMNEVPQIEVHIVQSTEPPGGMGEPGTSAIVPAISNAVFAATGKRLRKTPVDTSQLTSVYQGELPLQGAGTNIDAKLVA